MVRLSLLAATLGAVLAALAPASASSAVPCRDKIYNDWYKDGKIATTYPIACYRDALKHVPTDALTYSSLGDDIRSAMQGALARLHGKKTVPLQIGSGTQATSSSSGSSKGATGSTQPSKSRNPSTGGSSSPQPASSTVAAGSSSGSGGGLPVPIIVLGGLAVVLIAAGSIGAGVRHYRKRPAS